MGIKYKELHFGVAFANSTQELLSLKQNASGVMLEACNSSTGRLRWENELEASLGYTER